ncbi:putative N-alpha-acetyltransferase 25, NatB auxiliary subunit-like [Apostichopus japonicus]|uniref:Putative N-alpha-acetyltransferase 25, NatB auxiliary subunit-like n=1 Tax=Stichopus japonicus TaxID=307972 RepID=A0A2G8KZH6_STIJA|nr:putative N-alpha-acetyltransferase 25, NatB auxiliary subunit-like [Apostichopus japonicus]
MASHNHEDAVTERRLKPIYDNLDNGNYKVAMQSADKLLKKHRDLHCAKVLKALALLRLYRVQECETLAMTVVALKPTDEPTLQALSICFREMNKVELIVEIFSNAVKTQPSEEYYTHLFMALVRLEDFKRQQQTAMSLYKLVPKNAFYFWGVISAVMQALNSDNSLGQKMLLPLAERMVEKMIKEEKLEGESEVNLYLMILDLLGKHEKALEVVEGTLGKSLLKSQIPSRDERTAELFFKMQKWDKAYQAFREMLIKSPDNWLYYTRYLTSGFKLRENGWKPPDTGSEENATSHEDCNNTNKEESQTTDYDLPEMAAFISERIANEEEKVREKTGKALRGPYLAQLELLLRLSTQGKLEEGPQAGSIEDVLVRYFGLFADKTCCFSDLTPYLYMVPELERRSCLQRMEELVELKVNDGAMVYATSVKQLQRHLTSLKISRFYGFHDALSSEEKGNLASELIKRYKEGLSFGKGLLDTDLQYSDEYLLMAVHLLVDVWHDTEDESVLWRCLILLKIGHKHSQSSHHIKLLLMRFYCMAGVFTTVPSLYDGLDIKHMQQDTLGYNALKYAKSLGQLSSAGQFYNSTLRFFISGRREVTEYMIASYRFGTYEKIPEFLNFSTKIKHSLHFAHTAIEKKLLDILKESEKEGKSFTEFVRNMEIDPSQGTAEWDKVTDQRDLNIMVSWNPPHRQMSADDKAVSLRQETSWVKLRDYLLRLLAVSIDLQPSTHALTESQNNREKNVVDNKGDNYNAKESGKSLLQNFEDLLQACSKDQETRQKFPIQGPPTPLTIEYLDGNLGTVMALSFHLVQESYKINEAVADESSQTIQDSFCKHCEKLKNTLQESLKRSRRGLVREDGEKRILDREVLTELTLLTETSVYLVYLLGIACRSLSGLKNKISKRNKKKKNTPKPLPECIGTFQSMVEDIGQIIAGLQTAIRELESDAKSLDKNQLTLTYSRDQSEEFAEGESELWATVSESYQESLKELSELLQSKQELLPNL